MPSDNGDTADHASTTPLELLAIDVGAYHLCPIRNKHILVTHEELVRQSYVAKILTEQVSAARVTLEQAVGNWSTKRFPRCAAVFADPNAKGEWKGRADLVLWHIDAATGEDGVPLLVIEFKRGDLALADSGVDQLLDYADALQAPWVQLTNGQNALTFRRDDQSACYQLVEGLPPVGLLSLQDCGTPLPETHLSVTTSWEELCDPRFHARIDLRNQLVGRHTPFQKRPYIFDLVLALRDTQRQVQLDHTAIGTGFLSAVDCGLRLENQGTPGGTWQSITYRVFQLARRKDSPLFVGFGVTTWGKSSSRLMVRLWDANGNLAPHHSLQANLDTGLRQRENSCTIRHNGALTVGRGAVSRDRVFGAVRQVRPDLVNADGIDLGTYHHDGSRTILQNIVHVIENIINYCVIRDALRDEVQAERR